VQGRPASPVVLSIEQPVAEWRMLADVLRRTHLGVAATDAVLNHLGRVLQQVTQPGAGDPTAISK
jgi:hypothetical protein